MTELIFERYDATVEDLELLTRIFPIRFPNIGSYNFEVEYVEGVMVIRLKINSLVDNTIQFVALMHQTTESLKMWIESQTRNKGYSHTDYSSFEEGFVYEIAPHPEFSIEVY